MALEPLPKELSGLHVIATKHAKARLDEISLPFRRAVALIFNGTLEKPIQAKNYKSEKYGEKQEDIIYVRNGTYIFTIRKTANNFKPEEDILLLITVTDQRTVTENIPAKVQTREDFSWGEEPEVDYDRDWKHNKSKKGSHGRPGKEKGSFLRENY